MNSTDRVVVTTIVDADPKAAFQIFVEDVDSWWKRGLRYRPTAAEGGQMRFEPGAGGRLLETYKSNDGPFEIGRILVWEPGVRLVFDWRSPEFRPGEKTVVEVHFEPAGEGARVTVEHRGWDGIPAEHPIRHGWTGGAFASMIGLRWADQLTALRQRIHANFAGAPGSR